MVMAFDINFNDARFQEAMLKRRAGSPTKAINTGFDLIHDFAGQQGAMGLQLEQLGLQKKMAEHDLTMQQGRFDLQRTAFKQGLKDAKDDIPLSIALGLGTNIMTGLAARDRQKKQDALTANMDAWYKKYLKERGNK
jgi:hypothetical protein